jgi:protein TonB
MAFEAYLQHQTVRPRLGRRVTAVVSVAAHAMALAFAIAYSYWHVEELNPPRVEVTLMSAAAAPPPPPPPPPLGGGASTPPKHKVARPKVEVKPSELVQPKRAEDPEPEPQEQKEQPKEEPKETPASNGAPPGPGTPDGVKGGVAGGVKGGVVGGVVGGTGIGPGPTTPGPAKFLPPAMGAQQKISGADPDFPAHLRRPGVVYVVMAKITVNAAGVVESVALQKRAEPTLDDLVMAAVKTWRFRPLLANGKPIPFSYFGRFEFKSE